MLGYQDIRLSGPCAMRAIGVIGYRDIGMSGQQDVGESKYRDTCYLAFGLSRYRAIGF